MFYTRLLKYELPLVRGEDVVAVQNQLRELGMATGEPDGIYGPRTRESVSKFQTAQGLRPDGMVGPLTWNRLFGDKADTDYAERLSGLLPELTQSHGFRDSVRWALTAKGISIANEAPERTKGKPETVSRVWSELRVPLAEWSSTFGIPVELIIATICTESGGNLKVEAREEKGYVSDEETPNRVSPGIMQTLISTARTALGNDSIDRAWLSQPANSIQAGTAYIASQWKITHLDPPKVACAYNAGAVYYNAAEENRWKMRQYPVGTAAHADRFIKWLNDCFEVLGAQNNLPDMSFVTTLGNS